MVGLPEEIREFLRDHIASYEHLEVLLLLRKRAEVWSADRVAEALRIPEATTTEALEHLARGDLLRSHPDRTFEYGPIPTLAHTVDKLAECYEEERLAVMHVMNSNAIERVRNQALHIFADSFIVGRKKDKNG